MAESSFGRGAVNDWSFIRGLRAGRRVWPETEAKVRAFMLAHAAHTSPEPDTSAPRHAGVAPRVKAAKAEAADRPATGADLSGEAGSTIICAECERPATDETVRACQFRDCPRAGRWAA